MELLIIVGIWIACGIAALLIAQSKGLNASSWFLTGVVLGPLAIFMALVAKPLAVATLAPTTTQPSLAPLALFGTIVVGLLVAYVIVNA